MLKKYTIIYVLILFHISFASAQGVNEKKDDAFENFMSALQEFRTEHYSLESYQKLKVLYDVMQDHDTAIPKQWFAAQQLAMIDTFFGEYRLAEERQYQLNPEFKNRKTCPIEAVTKHVASSFLPTLVKDKDILLINESHTIISTRAFIIQILPTLKSYGFDTLAMEALNPDPESSSIESLDARGYPRNDFEAGYYLREPVMGELVRVAIAAGFKLIPFDTVKDGDRDEREEHQAEILSKYTELHPESKLVVISGHSHIKKSAGWMADRLQNKVNKSIVSIDQTSRLNGCIGDDDGRRGPFLFLDSNEKAWSSSPKELDISIIHNPSISEHTNRPEWLTLGRMRQPINVGKKLCGDIFPCLISAYNANEDINPLASDQMVTEKKDSSAWLYLKPGNYHVKWMNISGAVETKYISIK